MASLATNNDDDDDEVGQAQGGANPVTSTPNTTTAGGGASASSGTGGTGGTAPTTQPTSGSGTQGQSQNEQDVGKIETANSNVDFSPLLNYVSNQGTQARNAISTADNNFQTGLGSFSPFGSSDQTTLNSVLSGADPLSTGQSELDQSYNGPNAIDRTGYDPLISTYQQDAGYTQNPTGIGTLESIINPSLTQGERDYDSLVYGQNPAYQAQSQGLVNDANNVYGLGNTTATNDATAATQRGSDVSAFNQAAKQYVQSQSDQINSQIANQEGAATTADNTLQSDIPLLANGSMNISSLNPSQLAFNPTQYQPTTFASPDKVFNQTVNPLSYLTYNMGGVPDRNNVATPGQETQYNNAMALLNNTDQLMPSTRQGATLGLNQSAFQQALANAQAQYNAYMASLMQPQQAAAAAPAAAPDLNNGTIGSGTEGGAAGDGGGDAGDGGAGDGGSGGESGSFSKGGVINSKKRPVNLLNSNKPAAYVPPAPSTMQLSLAQGNQPSPQPMTAGTQSTTAQPGFKKGGFIPFGTSPNPNIKDDITAHVDDGEYVVRKGSVGAAGIGNMNKLNHLNNLPPAQQAMERKALAAALQKMR